LLKAKMKGKVKRKWGSDKMAEEEDVVESQAYI
jgi:hypothetical protein